MWITPLPQLQALLAEDAVEGLLDDAGLPGKERLAERRLEPRPHLGGKM